MMNREAKAFKNWSKSRPEVWGKIKTNLVDSYLSSDAGKEFLEFNMFNMVMFLQMKCVADEQAFLPPSVRPSDEQWHAALKPRVEPDAELAKQRQEKIRDILLTRLTPNYDKQQCEIADLNEMFINLDLEKPDATLEKPLSEEEVNKIMSALAEQIKIVESSDLSEDETLALVKKSAEEQLEYFRTATSTGALVLPSQLKDFDEKNEQQLRLLKASRPVLFEEATKHLAN